MYLLYFSKELAAKLFGSEKQNAMAGFRIPSETGFAMSQKMYNPTAIIVATASLFYEIWYFLEVATRMIIIKPT